jgi:Ran GTPase-activating protein (RanGAP) involved in mRNA processing and transport
MPSDNRALSSADLLGNFIPVEQAKELVKIMRAKENLTTLCGLSREETELDFSGQRLVAGDAVLIANDVSDMRAISSVNLLKNDIGVAQAEDLVSILKGHPTLKSLCGNKGNETALDMSGKMNGAADAIMLVAEIIDNRTLLQLDISNHVLSTENERAIAKLCDSKGVRLALEAAIPSVFGGGSSDY